MSNLPTGWKKVNLGDLVTVAGGGTPSRNDMESWGGNIPWATPTEITKLKTNFITRTKEYITDHGLRSSSAKLHPAGTLLMTSRASIGYCAINTVPMCTNQGFQSLLPKEGKVDNLFLLNLITLNRSELELLSSGSTFQEISPSNVRKLPLMVPTLKEQKKIAEILTSVDKVIELTEIEIEKLKNLKKGMMQDLLTKGIGHTKFKNTPLGSIPESWDCLKLSEISKLTVGVVCNATDHYVKEGGVPFVRSQNVRPDKINLDKLLFISEEFNQSQKKSILEEGDVMVVRTGYPGTAAVVTPELVGGNCFSLVLIKPKREVVLSQYLSIIINSDLVKNQIENMQFGSAQANFNVGEASNLNIPLPTFNEQELLVSCLKSASTNINNKMQKLEKLKDMKKGLMQDLLTGKVRVKV